MAADQVTPPPPPGFTIDPAQSLPSGFVMDTGAPTAKAPTPEKVTSSKAASFKQGLFDPVAGASQLLAHVQPERLTQAELELSNWMSKHGIGKGVNVTSTEGKPLAGSQAIDQLIKNEDASVEQQRQEAGRAGGADWYRLAGNVASPVNLTPAAGIAGKAASTGRLASLGGRAALGATQGAVAGATAPVTSGDFAAEKEKQIAAGAATGGLLPALTGAAARIIKPIGNEVVKKLTDAGISLTPGQILGGWWQRAEDAATSLPLVGDAIKGAQRRGIMTFNQSAINDSLKSIGDKLPKGLVGNEALTYARRSLSDAYDSLLPKLKGDLHAGPPANALPGPGVSAIPKPTFNDELNTIRQMGANLPSQQRKDLNRIIDKEVIGKFTSAGKALGDTLKQIQETLNKEANNFATGGPYERTLSGGIKEVGSALRRMINDVNPNNADELGKINAGYASFKRAQRAGSSVAAQDGVFTPAQYHNAVKALDKTKDKRAFSEGTALGQDLSAAAKSRLSQTVPDSGTPLRQLVTGAGGVATGSALGGIPGVAAALAAPALYSAPGTNLARLMLTTRPQGAQQLSNLVRGSSPALTAGAVPLAQLMQGTQD